MKKLLLIIILFSYSLPAQQVTGKIIKIKDGDTAVLLTQNKEQINIRLNGIDAPEKSQNYGQKSKQYLSDLIFGKQVGVKTHGSDIYGRVLGDIFLSGRNINYEMVRNGYAWMYRKYTNDKNLDKLELEAKSAKRGLWADPHAIPPWDYRRR